GGAVALKSTPAPEPLQAAPLVKGQAEGGGKPGTGSPASRSSLPMSSLVKEQAEASLEPDLIITLPPPPPAARFAVQTRRELDEHFSGANAAIALVLDCSGSMDAPVKGGPTRWKAATKALQRVLRNLPRGVTVSLRVFSAKEHGRASPGSELVWEAHKWGPDDL